MHMHRINVKLFVIVLMEIMLH